MKERPAHEGLGFFSPPVTPSPPTLTLQGQINSGIYLIFLSQDFTCYWLFFLLFTQTLVQQLFFSIAISKFLSLTFKAIQSNPSLLNSSKRDSTQMCFLSNSNFVDPCLREWHNKCSLRMLWHQCLGSIIGRFKTLEAGILLEW